MTERFKKAYNALINAYFGGTLAKSTCLACACGNIIADAAGIEFEFEDTYKSGWGTKNQQVTSLWAHRRTSGCGMYIALPAYEDVVNIAGYTAAEFAKIETAFEHNTEIPYYLYNVRGEQDILEDQYKGLCAVVDVLLELDKDTSQGEEYKVRFRQHPKLQIC